MSTSLTKTYEPAVFESSLYQEWLETGCFEASDTSTQPSFTISLPPPNVTGVLHMGHALGNTIQDILIRWQRMKGANALWMPGSDHAGIATQIQVEKAIAKEGKNAQGRPMTRHDIGRAAFLDRTWKWKEEHGDKIRSQMKKMGGSFDWKRERFTMDEGFSQAVRTVFVRLHQEGLIYRGERIINWCTRCQTALSDLEVVATPRKGKLWKIRYPVVEKDGTPVVQNGQPVSLTVATTRPETLMGDVAVAIHPEDDRYTAFHGKFVMLPLMNHVLPIVLDTYVDREFGTGALKVTPAHDTNDAEIGVRHSLSAVSVMGQDGKILPAGGSYAGLTFKEARERVLQDLVQEELFVGEEPHDQQVGQCQRCDTVAEPLLSKQWFVKMKPLAEPALKVVADGEIQFYPETWVKTYNEWLTNIRDWCISRQLWWGHQIPAWHCADCSEITVAESTPGACTSCQSKNITQDEDVLDTWFSSALWPFGTLGWPEQTKALETFYPNAVMETGFDILFFWVARMIMMGLHFTGKVPFKRVYLHAMVRDEHGDKMSKSKGNVIDPLTVSEQHGTDALRLTLAIFAGQGRDIKLSVDRVEGYRAFCNKIWNAVRFLHFQLEQGAATPPPKDLWKWFDLEKAELDPMHRWIVSRLEQLVPVVEAGFDRYEINVAAQALYDFVWGELCDWYIEMVKLPIRAGGKDRDTALWILHGVLERVLALLHPITPFVTEQLWRSLPWRGEARAPINRPGAKIDTLMLQPFPRAEASRIDRDAERMIESLQQIVLTIRNFRGENQIPPSREFAVEVLAVREAGRVLWELHWDNVKSLARLSGYTWIQAASDAAPVERAVFPLTQWAIELRIPLEGLVNREEEQRRLAKETETLKADIAFIQKKLENPQFVDKAPAALVTKERDRLAQLEGKLRELTRQV